MSGFDDFERADGPIGPNWVDAPGADASFSIDTGAAVATLDAGNTHMYWHEVQPPAQTVEVEVENIVPENNGYIRLFTNINADDEAKHLAEFDFYPDDELVVGFYQYDAAGVPTLFGEVTVAWPTLPALLRFETEPDGTQNAYVADELVLTEVATSPAVGDFVGMGLTPTSGGGTTSPRILAFAAGPLAPKISWVSGWRTGEATGEVNWDDVNLGTSDIQSAQCALVVETLAPGEELPLTGPIILGGATNYYTGAIISAAAYDAVGDPIWEFNPSMPLGEP